MPAIMTRLRMIALCFLALLCATTVRADYSIYYNDSSISYIGNWDRRQTGAGRCDNYE
jgi:hypothetical protein